MDKLQPKFIEDCRTASADEDRGLSIYTDVEATPVDIAAGIAKLAVAFPRNTPQFWGALASRISTAKFTKQRLTDSVEHLMDTYKYKELSIADVIGFDKKRKLYTYSQVCDMVTKGLAELNEFNVVTINGIHYRVRKDEEL